MDFLFFCLDLLSGLNLFKKEEKEKYIYHFYPNTCLKLATFYCYLDSRINILMALLPLYHFHYSPITNI